MMSYLDNCTYAEDYGPPHTYTFTGPCRVLGTPYSVTLPADGLYAYNQGAFVQDAFPALSADDREFIISGFSPQGWEKIFGNSSESCDPPDE